MIRRSHKLLLSVGVLASLAGLQFAAAQNEVGASEPRGSTATTDAEAWTDAALSFMERAGLVCASAACEEHEP